MKNLVTNKKLPETMRMYANVSASKMVWKEKDGKRYLTGPVVMMKEGVLNGVLYKSEEMAKFPKAWNGRPVPVTHPTDPSGNPLSANSPEVEEQYVVGNIYNTTFEEGKLKAEAWVDPDKANVVDPTVLNTLMNKEVMEVSTGLWFDEIMEEGEYNGVPYTSIAVNFRPDHLALLPNEIGACSVADGAGFPRLNSDQDQKKLFGNFLKYLKGEEVKTNELSFDDITSQLRLAVKAEQPSPLPSDIESMYIYVLDVFDKYFIYEIETYDGQNYLPKLYRRSYVVSEDDSVTLGEVATEVRRKTEYQAVTNEESKALEEQGFPTTNKEKGAAPMKEKIDAVIANSANQFGEDDRDFLAGLTEEQLDKFAANSEQEEQEEPAATPEKKTPAPAVNNSELLEQIGGLIDSKLSTFREELATNEKQPLVDALVANKSCPLTKETLQAMSVEELQGMQSTLTPHYYGGQGGGALTANSDEDNEIPAPPALFEQDAE